MHRCWRVGTQACSPPPFLLGRAKTAECQAFKTTHTAPPGAAQAARAARAAPPVAAPPPSHAPTRTHLTHPHASTPSARRHQRRHRRRIVGRPARPVSMAGGPMRGISCEPGRLSGPGRLRGARAPERGQGAGPGHGHEGEKRGGEEGSATPSSAPPQSACTACEWGQAPEQVARGGVARAWVPLRSPPSQSPPTHPNTTRLHPMPVGLHGLWVGPGRLSEARAWWWGRGSGAHAGREQRERGGGPNATPHLLRLFLGVGPGRLSGARVPEWG